MHNLANATTTGFKAQLDSFRAALPVIMRDYRLRAFVVDATASVQFLSGALQQTGRDLTSRFKGGVGW